MAQSFSWPPEYSAKTLRERYSDLETMNDQELSFHYESYGRIEGRIAAEMALRENVISLLSRDISLLEIGPFCQPVFRGPLVKYMDILDAEGLRRRASEIGIETKDCPEEIHFVGTLDGAAGSRFDVVFSSHNIEHQPDFLKHLNDVEQTLAEGGWLVLLVPDKRYCFDHFLPETTIPEILEAFMEKRTRHSARHVIEHIALTCHNDVGRHWQGDHGPRPDPCGDLVPLAMKHEQAAGEDYVDVHAGKFTPQSFRQIVEALSVHRLTRFVPERVYDTPLCRNEFVAVLRLAGS
jgi:SAM-dependent methyltransferase